MLSLLALGFAGCADAPRTESPAQAQVTSPAEQAEWVRAAQSPLSKVWMDANSVKPFGPMIAFRTKEQFDPPQTIDGKQVTMLISDFVASCDGKQLGLVAVTGYDAAETIQALKDKLEQPATIFIRD